MATFTDIAALDLTLSALVCKKLIGETLAESGDLQKAIQAALDEISTKTRMKSDTCITSWREMGSGFKISKNQ